MMEKQMIPRLRFPEFDEVWESKPFKEITKINQGLQIPISERYLEKVENSHFYITNEFLKSGSEKKYFIKNPSKSVLCTEDDILMTRTGNTGMVVTNVSGAFHNNFFKIAYPDYINKLFLYYFLTLENTQNFIKRLAGTSTIPDLNHSDFYKIKFNFPQLPEQQKLASFLTDVDDKIAKLTKKKELLEQYKKGLMQKIFNQELRFKDDKGNEFPSWQKKKLGELLDYQQPTKYIVKSTEYDNSFKTPVLTAGKSFLLGYTNETEGIYNKLPTIIFDDFTMANKFVDFEFKVKSSAMKILQPKTDEVNIKFVYEAIQMINYPKGDEHKRFWISEYSKIKIGYPCRKEQTKIANFLSDIDVKIEGLATQIEKSNVFKKGLLQKMFV